MKKVGLFKLLVGLTLAASGAFAVGSALSNKKAEAAEASTNLVYLHASSGWTDASAWFAIYQYQSASTSANSAGIYFVNNSDWSTLKIYLFDGPEGSTNYGWPGADLGDSNKVGKLNGKDVYYYNDANFTSGTFSFIVSDNGSDNARTGNVTGNNKKCVWNGSAGSGNSGKVSDFVYAIKNGSDSWSKMSQVSYSGSDKTYYQGNVESSGYSFIFVRMNPASQDLDWNNKWTQTSDLHSIDSGKNCYQIDNMNGSGSWHTFNPDGDNLEYAVGTFGVKNTWTVASGLKLVSNSSTELKVTLPLKAGDQFRFYLNNYLDAGYEGSEKFVVKGDSPVAATKNGNNIVLPNNLTEGAYIVYWSYADSNWGLYIASSTDTAESLAMYIMQYDTDGQCTPKFEKARTRYLAMANADATEATNFRNSAAAQRYESWAAALGQNPYAAGAATSRTIAIGNGENTNTIAIIVIISLVSVTAIGGYFFIKRRQEN